MTSEKLSSSLREPPRRALSDRKRPLRFFSLLEREPWWCPGCTFGIGMAFMVVNAGACASFALISSASIGLRSSRRIWAYGECWKMSLGGGGKGLWV